MSDRPDEKTAQEPSTPAPTTEDDVLQIDAEEAEVEELEANDLELSSPDEDPPSAERLFYVAEAAALAARQPERAALMWLEAAEAGARGGSTAAMAQQVAADLDAAQELRSDSLWLLPRSRRLLMRLRHYERALKIGQREVKLGGDTGTRASVLLESAAVVSYELKKPEVASKLLDAALQLHPGHVAVLTRAVELRRAQGAHAAAAHGLEALAENLTDPTQRAMHLYAAGTLHEHVLDDIEAARTTYLRGAEADPQNVPLKLALCDVHRQTGDLPALGRALEQLAELIEAPSFKGRLLRLAGMLLLDVGNDLEGAARVFGRASRALPEDRSVWTQLAQVQRNRGRAREAIDALRRLLNLTLDKEGRAALLTQIAQLHAGLHETEQAIAANRDALAEVESYLPALQALGTLHRQRGDFESLIAIAQPETEGLLPAEARAIRCLDLADTLAYRLERPEDAVPLCRRAIELAPRLHLAYWALARLLERLAWHEELAELYGQHAEVCTDAETRAQLVLLRARVEAGPLGRPDQAAALLAEVQDQSLRAPFFEHLALLERTRRHAALVEALLAQADATTDVAEAEGRRVHAALVLERELSEPDRALEIHRSVLDANPKSHAAIHGTGRILHTLGRWGDLVRLHHHELTIEPERPDVPILLTRVGRLLEDHLGNGGAALGAYSKALKQDPTYTPALAAIDRLARSEGRWADYVDILQRHAAGRKQGDEAMAALLRGGDIANWVLGDFDRAAELYQQALELEPTARAALEGLVQVRLRQKAFGEAAVTLQELADRAKDAEERGVLALGLARLVELRLKERVDLASYKTATEAPFGDQVRLELLRVLQQEDRVAARTLQRSLGEESGDNALAGAYLLGVAHELEFATNADADGAAKDRELLLDAAQSAHERLPEDGAVLWCFERQLRAAADAEQIAALYEREAQLELDRTLRVQALVRAAEAHHEAENLEAADRLCQEALNFDGHSLPALRLLAASAEARGDGRQLASLCDRLAAACLDADNRLSSCLRAATVWQEQVDDESRALASLAVALADDPAQESAFTRAEALLRRRGEHDELSRLYQRRIRATDDATARADLLRRHATLLEAELAQPDRAIAELDALLLLAPNDSDARRQLATLHQQRGHWSDAANTLTQLLERTVDAEARQVARLELAELWLKKLHEPERARAVLAACEAEGPGDARTVRLRVELDALVGAWVDARQALETLAEREEAPLEERLWAYLRWAEIARSGLHDEAMAKKALGSALRLAKDDKQALSALRTQCSDKGDKAQLVVAAEELLGAGEDPTLRRLIGRILLEDLDEREKAAAQLRQVVEALPDDGEARLLLARALERSQRGEAQDLYRGLLAEPPMLLPACRGLLRCAPRETALAAATMVDLFGQAGDEERVQLEGLSAALDDDTNPSGRFPSEALPQNDDEALERSLELLAPHLDELLEREAGRRAEDGIAALARELGRPLGLKKLEVELVDGDGAVLVGGDPPLLRVGRELEGQSSGPWRRYVLGRALASSDGSRVGLASLADRDLEDLFSALHERKPEGERRQQLKKALSKILPRKTRKALEQLGPPAKLGKLAEVRALFANAGERLALVLARHPGVVLRHLAEERKVALTPEALLGERSLARLLQFALSKDYARLYHTIWG